MSEMETWTIYSGVSDVDAPFCVRRWTISAASMVAHETYPAQTLHEARAVVRREGGDLVRFDRHPTDDPVVIETWL